MNTPRLEKEIAIQGTTNLFSPDKELVVLVKKYELYLSSCAYCFLRDSDAVKDILQEVWLNVYQQLRQQGKEWLLHTNVRAWLGKVVHNASLNYLSKHRRTIPFSMISDGSWLLEQRVSQFEQPDIVAAREELNRELEDILDQLPFRIRGAIYLHYFDDQSLQEIADIFQCPLNTIKSDMRRGKSYLSTRFRAKGIQPADIALWADFKELFIYEVVHMTSIEEASLPEAG